MKKRLRILCADDNRLLGDVLVALFTKAGHVVEFFQNGGLAWERLRGDLGHFDVVVTDQQMPGLTGLELVERLHTSKYRGRIVVHCSVVTPEQHERYHALGTAAIVLKSSRAEPLLAAVEGAAADKR
ncbi:hypothetical protein DB347_25130 [Opitutaceae bacterium EW11]|nr:hypothetical protein DB347_25130 [Opitutaceae bacterium EW11]